MQKIRSQRLLHIMLVSLIMMLCLQGCASKGDVSQTKKKNTFVVTDSIGRKVQVPVRVTRIACLDPFSGYVLLMLGRGNQIVATVGGLKRDKLLTDMYPKIKDAVVPKVSGGVNVETLLGSQPDVIFVKGDMSTNDAEMDKLDKINIPYLIVDFNSIKEQQAAAVMIGKTVGNEAKALEYNAYYKDCLARVSKLLGTIPMERRVKLYHSINEATRTDSKGTLPADWTNAAGANNISVNSELKSMEGNYYASLEQILLWNPDVILANEAGVANYILTEKPWALLKAVKNKKVLQLPVGLSRWGHPNSLETPLAVMWTAQVLYPERMQSIDMKAETKTFYKRFLNYDIDDNTTQKVLEGKGILAARKVRP